MKLKVDQEADALYLALREAPASRSEEIAPGMIPDYDEQDRVVGARCCTCRSGRPKRRPTGCCSSRSLKAVEPRSERKRCPAPPLTASSSTRLTRSPRVAGATTGRREPSILAEGRRAAGYVAVQGPLTAPASSSRLRWSIRSAGASRPGAMRAIPA